MPQPRIYWPPDGGLIYAETPLQLDHGQWLIEPWNAISSLLIILPGIYFLFRLRGQWRQYPLLVACAPLLILGGLGSTLYHALRNDRWLVLLDVMPTLTVFVVMIAFLWYRVLRHWLPTVLVLGACVGVYFLVYRFAPVSLRINAAYFIRGFAFFLPLLILLIRTRFKRSVYILTGLAFFLAALVFRYYDKNVLDIFPMGSHFLWHAATGIGGILIAEYLIGLGNESERFPDDGFQARQLEV